LFVLAHCFFDIVFLNRSEKKAPESSVLTKEMDAHLNILGLGLQTQAVGAYPHPYQYELDHFQWDEEKLKPRPIQPLKSLEETPYEWIDTPEALQKLLDKLNQCTEIAVDLEVRFFLIFCSFLFLWSDSLLKLHLFVYCFFQSFFRFLFIHSFTHSFIHEFVREIDCEFSLFVVSSLQHHAYRSYQGFTCLLQISTRTEDYIIDAIQLRKHLYLLNRPFTNPNIVKVRNILSFQVTSLCPFFLSLFLSLSLLFLLFEY
jgi:hypothetical protein